MPLGIWNFQMGTNPIADIDALRARLDQIQEERRHLTDDDPRRRGALLETEHQLESKLARLLDDVARRDELEAREEAAEQTDLTTTPRLPEEEG